VLSYQRGGRFALRVRVVWRAEKNKKYENLVVVL